MAKKTTKIAPVSPVLDNVLTFIFLAEFVGCMYGMFIAKGDYLGVCLFAGGLVAMHCFIGLSNRVFSETGRFISSTLLKHAPFNDPLQKKVVRNKFVSQGWQLVVHVSMALADWYVICDEDWFYNPKQALRPFDIYTPAPTKSSVKWLLLVQLTVWMYTCFSHRFIEERRKDYVEMYVHHVATIFLVGGIQISGGMRFGTMILFLHDVSDIPIDSMKMVNYLKLEDAKGFFLSEIFFTGNLISWIYFRLYRYPISVWGVASAWWECWPKNIGELSASVGVSFLMFLSILQCLHLFWFYLLLRIGYKVLVAQSIHEAGEEEYEGGSEDEDDDTAKKTK